jgi:zinc transporter, ZIP family
MFARPYNYNYGLHPADHDPRRGARSHARPDAEPAVDCSGVAYTTVGDGDLVLAKPWRLLAPIEGLTGSRMGGLSMGVCGVAVVNRIDQAVHAPTSGTGELAREGHMTSALLWGMFAASSLVIGGLLAFWCRISHKMLGLIMAFGSGVLISAVAFELAHKSVELSHGSGMATLGLFAGALVFFAGDRLISHMGGEARTSIGAAHDQALGLPITLGIVLDGVPESIVIGLSLLGGHTISLAMLMAVFISNVPEAIAATTGLGAGGWSRVRIMRLWLLIVVVCGVASLAGFVLLEHASHTTQAFINTFAGGAILVMLADTMIPEAFEHGGKPAGLVNVMGFALAAYVSTIS